MKADTWRPSDERPPSTLLAVVSGVLLMCAPTAALAVAVFR